MISRILVRNVIYELGLCIEFKQKYASHISRFKQYTDFDKLVVQVNNDNFIESIILFNEIRY